MSRTGHNPDVQTATRVRVVGCGRGLRRDDQIGLRVAERLADLSLDGDVEVTASEAPAADVLLAAADVSLLVLIDAVAESPQLPGGGWRRLDLLNPSAGDPRPVVPEGAAMSPHMLGLSAGLELARRLGMLPKAVWLYVVAGRDFGYGEGMTTGVADAIREVASAIQRDLRQHLRRGGGEHA